MNLFIDTETFSECDIRKSGAAKYARHKTTECLMFQWAHDTGSVGYVDLAAGESIPLPILGELEDPEITKIAFNVPFDKDIINFTMGIDIPWDQWKDAQTLAYSLGFTGSMAKCQEAMGFSEDVAKLKEGNKLIKRFCMPQPKNHKTRRWTGESDPENWQKFIDYGVRDVESMRMMWSVLEPYQSMSTLEWDYWRITQAMNDRGIPIDIDLVETAKQMVTHRKHALRGELIELTGLDNPNSAKQLHPWLSDHGVDLPNMQAATVDDAIKNLQPCKARQVLQFKRTLGQTAVMKWDAIGKMECNGVVQGQFIFRGASRTGRDASRGINLQNLRRPPKGAMDTLIADVYKGDNDYIQIMHGEPLNFLAGTVRGAITAPEGKMLVVSDLASIESRVLAHVSGCSRMISIFAAGRDTYKDYATELFNVQYDDVTKDQRTFSKPPVLGAGYMMGGEGLSLYADSMGVPMSKDESQHAVDVFRAAYPEIPKFWYWIIDAVMKAMQGASSEKYNLKVYVQGDFLFIRLPSGRAIAYHRPLAKMIPTPWGEERMGFTYMGINRFNLKWERINAHAGGLTENCIQAIARDVLMEWVGRCRNLDIVGRVHDELIIVADEGVAQLTLDLVNEQVAIPMPWASTMLLSAEGFITKHYTKD